MLVTNGKKIIAFPAQDLEELSLMLKKRAKDVLGIKAKFAVKSEPYEHIENEIEFDELKKITFPDIDVQFRAIGDEKVQMPQTVIKDIKHTYAPEEKQLLADSFVNIQYEKEQVEKEAKEVAKGYKQKIDQMENQISDLASKHRQGYEIISLECNLHLDFENKNRVYTELDSKELLSVEPLEPKDYQMKMDFKDGGFDFQADEDVKGEGDE